MTVIEFKWLHCPNAFRVQGPRPTGSSRAAPSRRGWKEPNSARSWIETKGKQWFDLYSPGEIPALFQRFADAPHTAEGMCDFFNAYGPLRLAGDRKPSAGLQGIAQSVDEPLREHAAIRRALESLKAGDFTRLLDSFNQNDSRRNWHPPGWGVVRTELRARAGGALEYVFVPSNLIHFMWLKLALFATSNSKLLRCEHCSEPFVVGTGTRRRSTAKFCSNACKVAAFRARQANGEESR